MRLLSFAVRTNGDRKTTPLWPPSTGNAPIDSILSGLIALRQTAFPGRIGSYCLGGSFADGTVVPSSDLDLAVIFAGTIAAEEMVRFKQAVAACAQHCPLAPDVTKEPFQGLTNIPI